MNESQIESRAERMMDQLDRRYLAQELTQAQYDCYVRAIDAWTRAAALPTFAAANFHFRLGSTTTVRAASMQDAILLYCWHNETLPDAMFAPVEADRGNTI